MLSHTPSHVSNADDCLPSGRENRLKVNLKVEVRGRGSTGGITPLLQTQHIVFSNICSGVFYNILGVE